MDYIFVVLASLYGFLTIFTGLVQFKVKNINKFSSVFMIIGGFIIIISAILLSITIIIGLFIIHVCAISNGLEMYGKINVKHHLVRLLFSLLLIFLYLV